MSMYCDVNARNDGFKELHSIFKTAFKFALVLPFQVFIDKCLGSARIFKRNHYFIS